MEGGAFGGNAAGVLLRPTNCGGQEDLRLQCAPLSL
jgi:hypothetical protein